MSSLKLFSLCVCLCGVALMFGCEQGEDQGAPLSMSEAGGAQSSHGGTESGTASGTESGTASGTASGTESGTASGTESGAEGGQTPEVEPSIELGTGFRQFEPLEPGAEVPIIEGIQGGFHVWGAFKGRGFHPENVMIFFTLSLEGEVIAEADYFEFELPVDRRTGEYVYAGVSVIYYDNARVEPSSGHEMLLHLEVTTEDGLTLTDEQRLTPICCEPAF